jgi:hypothetical protein
MSAVKTRSPQWKTLRKHVLALARYRGTDDDLLREVFEEVLDAAGRRILMAVLVSARQFNEAAYYQQHSALADEDATEQAAQAQIRAAHKIRDKVLDNIVDKLLLDIPRYIEEPLAKVAAGEVRWADLAVDGLAGVTSAVAAIRELCDGQGDEALQS